MPADKINYSDTLRIGTDKINDAIDAANIAETVSESADAKATEALATSGDTQLQLDTIVIDGDSSVEAAQARVPVEGVAYSTLKQRLDSEHGQVSARLAETERRLNDNPISPDDFQGNNVEKISQAIQLSILENRTVKFSKMYDITGLGVIVINKPATNRRMLYLDGSGGGIRKNDSGYFFSTTLQDQGDVISTNMKYESVEGVNSCVFDGNKMIRLGSNHDSYINVDTIIEANNRWLQSIRIVHSTVLGGKGWAISARYMFDCSFENNTVEIREHFVRNYYPDNATLFLRDNMNLRIKGNVIEGLSGTAMRLGACYATVISGNYMESNEGDYFDLSANPNTTSHAGLEVSNNMIDMSATQISANIPGIKWGYVYSDVVSSGNVSNGLLHSVTIASIGKILSTGDFSAVDKIVNDLSRVSIIGDKMLNHVKTTNTKGEIKTLGSHIIQQSLGIATVSIASGMDLVVNIPMPTAIIGPATIDFLVVPQWMNNTHQIINYSFGAGFNSINVKIKNLHTTASTFTVYGIAQHFKY